MFAFMSLSLAIMISSSDFFTETQQSISFCYKMKIQAVFRAERKAGKANLLDVSGSVDCVPCCLSLLTHHLRSCLLEALQSLFLSSCQAFLQFYMSLHKNQVWTSNAQKSKSTQYERKQALNLLSTNTYIYC